MGAKSEQPRAKIEGVQAKILVLIVTVGRPATTNVLYQRWYFYAPLVRTHLCACAHPRLFPLPTLLVDSAHTCGGYGLAPWAAALSDVLTLVLSLLSA